MEGLADFEAWRKDFGVAVREKGDLGSTAGRKTAGLALACSITLHAALFAAFVLPGSMKEYPRPNRETLHVSWVSIVRDVRSILKAPDKPAGKTLPDERRQETAPEVGETREDPAAPRFETALGGTEEAVEPLSPEAPEKTHGGTALSAAPEYVPSSRVRESVAVEKAPPVVSTSAESRPAESPRMEDGIRPPQYLDNNRPDYPLLARLRGYEGVVWLSVEVSPEGRVGDLRVKKSSGFEVLDRSAVRAVKTWRFEPARKSGSAVPMWVDLPIRFTLTDGRHAS